MKTRFLNVALVVAGLLVPAVGSAGIKADMKELGGIYKGFVNGAQDKTKYPEFAKQALHMAELFKAASALTPDSISSMPTAKQAPALAEYRSMLKKEEQDATDLSQAFKKGDSAAVATILKDMKAGKSMGHDKFAD